MKQYSLIYFQQSYGRHWLLHMAACLGTLCRCSCRCGPVLQADNAERRALVALPLLSGATVGVVLGLVLLKARATAAWPAWQLGLVPCAAAAVIAGLVQLLLVPVVRLHLPAAAARAQAAPPGARPRLVSEVELAAEDGKGDEQEEPQTLQSL